MNDLRTRLALCTLALTLIIPTFAAWAANGNQIAALGAALFRDLDLSLNQNQACVTCHHPSAGFADPANRMEPDLFPVSEGSDPTKYGGRNAPSAAYAGFSPLFDYDSQIGFFGGMFWDGRATGWTLGDPLAEQAQGPFLNPVEMALPDKYEVVAIVAASRYATLFERVFGPNALDDVDEAYDNIGRAIAAFERGPTVTRFHSRFDAFLAGDLDLTGNEAAGMDLFNQYCVGCHPSQPADDGTPPLFTDYTYANLGLPVNPRIAALAGDQDTDWGLGGRTVELTIAYGAAGGDPDDLDTVIEAQAGKFKVPTLRNVARSAPYGHNGYFPTLYDMVHFLNARDAMEDWVPEVGANLNEDLGALGLSFEQEMQLVQFLKTLTD